MTDQQSPQPLSPAQDEQWAAFSHFGGLIGIVPSLLIYLIFKDRGARTNRESRAALNWQITFTIAFVALQIVNVLVALALSTIGAYDLSWIGSVLVFGLWVVNAVFSIMGGLRVLGGGEYTYPVSLRLIR